MPVDEDEGIALVERMIAERDHVGPRIEKIVEDPLRDPEAPRRVLPVHHDEIELQLVPEPRQDLEQGVAPSPPDHVAEE